MHAMPQVRFEMLGQLTVVTGAQRIHLASHRHRVVLAMLLLTPGRPVSTHALTDALWGQNPPATARNQVQGCVSALRRVLTGLGAPDLLVTCPAGYELRAPLDSTDLGAVLIGCRRANDLVEQGNLTEAVALLKGLLSRWHGGLLSDVESFSVHVRARAHVEELERVRLQCVDWEMELGRHTEVIGELYEMLARDAASEPVRGRLMTALHGGGRTAEALAVYREGRRVLVEQLGLEPGPDLRRIETRILSGDAEPVKAGVSALRPQQPLIPRQLPPAIADFTARTAQTQQLSAVLNDGGGPGGAPTVVALAGPAGSGKSALAVQVAQHIATHRFPDGQLWADLVGGEPVPADEILARFLRSLGVSRSEVPTDARERAELYRSLLADKAVLVLLDNAASEAQIRALLPAGPRCAVVVTSRFRPTGLPGVRIMDVEPFSVEEGVRALAAIVGARRVTAEPTAARRLVEMVDGLPLGVRVLGSRLAARPHWSLRSLVGRLAEPRRLFEELVHQDLAVHPGIETAYALLPAMERNLLQSLCRLQDEEVTPALCALLLDTDRDSALELMENLLEAHLLRVPVDRAGFRIPSLVRAFVHNEIAAPWMPPLLHAADTTEGHHVHGIPS
ncbi:BTAD domain-containing putative transcriptional regulator [Streptomyces sp. NPDC051001]|uniref:AfsR/SARP family transcriptional regulator n=1 Tax=Streptomyces sp. NPDC051001 TaxID=3155795 RepID=UPI00341D2439